MSTEHATTPSHRDDRHRRHVMVTGSADVDEVPAPDPQHTLGAVAAAQRSPPPRAARRLRGARGGVQHAVPRAHGARGPVAQLGDGRLLDARHDDDARVRRHHVPVRRRARLLGGGAAVGLGVPARAAAVHVHPVRVPAVDGAAATRAGRRGSSPPDTSGHLVLTGLGPIEDALDPPGRPGRRPVRRCSSPSCEEALRLHDRGYRVMVGRPRRPRHVPRAPRRRRPRWSPRPAPTRRTPTSPSPFARSRRTVPIVATASRSRRRSTSSSSPAPTRCCSSARCSARRWPDACSAPTAGATSSASFAGAPDRRGRASPVRRSSGRTLAEVRPARPTRGRDHRRVAARRRSRSPVRRHRCSSRRRVLILAGIAPSSSRRTTRCYARRPSEHRPPSSSSAVAGSAVPPGGRSTRPASPYRIVEQQRRADPEPDSDYVLGDAAELDGAPGGRDRRGSAPWSSPPTTTT